MFMQNLSTHHSNCPDLTVRDGTAAREIHATSKDMADPKRLAGKLFHDDSCHPTLKCSIDAVNHSHIDAAGTTWRVNVGVYTNDSFDNPSGTSSGTWTSIKGLNNCLEWCQSKSKTGSCEFDTTSSKENC